MYKRQVNTSKYRRTLVFSTTNPYFTPEGISRTLDVYYRTDKPYEDQGGNYQLVTTCLLYTSRCV